MNETASDVWRLADGEHTPDELAALLATGYGTDAATLRGDVERLLDGLAAAGLLPGARPAPPPVALRVLDVPVGLLVEDAALHGLLGGLWADCAEPSDAEAPDDRAPDDEARRPVVVRVTGHGPWQVSSPAHRVEAASLPAAVGEACAAVNLSAVAATPLLAFHAAVLRHGATTVAVPGASGVGKSTLTAALLLEGWELVSDEALALPWRAGPPAAYPRPLALSDWSRATLAAPDGVEAVGEHFLRAADLGSRPAASVGPVSDVVLLRRSDDPPELVSVGRTEALQALLPRGFTSVQDPAAALGVLGDVLTGARTWALVLGDPRRAARLLTERLVPAAG
nr:PqqD family protein [Motilibacter deserti]